MTWKKIMLRIGLVVLGLAVIVGATGFYIYHQVAETTSTIYQPIEKTTKRSAPLNMKEKNPFSVLLLGVDKRPGDKGRSDSLMVMTVNPTKHTTKIISIPRDTRTEIVGKNSVDKINHAFAFGGIQMTVNTVEKFLNIPIDYYLEVNMEGFKDIVDAIGGVEVMNTLDFTNDGFHFKKGLLSLNGEKALSFSRMRYEDPQGDFGREARQRQIIQEVINKGTKIKSLVSYKDILNSINKNLETNFTMQQMFEIQKDYRGATASIEQQQLQGSGKMIKGIYYYLVPEKNRLALSNELRDQLGLAQ
ncbi:LytR family transcriptional regulator [Bacillus sp. AFS002410]|uniref:LCP family glycopolymer transferase n=1 Tax=Bacillus sp. AFS002410 TaxID=2033481 RepID=UPI000BEF64DE|nr:LCP family protein [Bacillus sp. AFS002410]PEJ58434.1 LytR family transcriptional regulator [Bacillus sp. AFS002410]